MSAKRGSEPVSCDGAQALIEVLAGYLLAAPVLGPGADGPTVEDAVVAGYPAALAWGLVPGPDELARRHPELAEAIGTFIAGRLPGPVLVPGS